MAATSFLGTVMGTGKLISELKSIIEKFGRNKADAVAALTLVNQLQQYVDDLRTQNDELRRERDETNSWKSRLSDLELIVATGGARVYRSRSNQTIYYCPGCLEKHLPIPLQPGGDGRQNCRECKAWFQVEPEPTYTLPPPQENPWNRRFSPRRY